MGASAKRRQGHGLVLAVNEYLNYPIDDSWVPSAAPGWGGRMGSSHAAAASRCCQALAAGSRPVSPPPAQALYLSGERGFAPRPSWAPPFSHGRHAPTQPTPGVRPT